MLLINESLGNLAQHAKFLLQSSFGVTFGSFLEDVETARKLTPMNAAKIDQLVISKRDKIHRWLLENINAALRSKGLRKVEVIPWSCLSKSKIQRHNILLKGWPHDIPIRRFITKKHCEIILTLLHAKQIQVILELDSRSFVL